MPPQRNRGSYAKYICLNCRSRKIKCALPDDVEILPDGQAQPTELSCQRCRIKGLECVVDHTTLGRPSQQPGLANRTRMRMSPQTGSLAGSASAVSSGQASDFDVPDERGSEAVEGYLIVHPRQAGSRPEIAVTKENEKPAPLDKFLALVDSKYLLSTLLLRDRQFAVSLSTAWMSAATVSPDILDESVVKELDHHLVWQRLYFPNIPLLPELHAQLMTMSQHDLDYGPTILLLALLCSIAFDSQPQSNARLKASLNALVFRYGQQILFTLPPHRHAVLALELMAEYKPLALAIDRTTAAYAVRGRMIPPLIKEMALNIGLNTAPQRLQVGLNEGSLIERSLMLDCLQWYRLSLVNTPIALGKDVGEQKSQQMHGSSALEAASIITQLSNSGQVPTDMRYALQSLLVSAHRLEALLKVYSNRRDLRELGNILVSHRAECDVHRNRMRSLVHTASGPGSEYTTVAFRLIDMELHSSWCWVSGSALFFCVMAGAEAVRNAAQTSDSLSAEEALQISDHIIDRLADNSRDQQMADAHTAFLIKFGERRMDDLELVLADFIAVADSLKLSGAAFVPPLRSTVCGIFYTCRDIMEGNAARMKGWGALHDRAHMQLLLMRDCAATLERIGGGSNVESNMEGVRRGCLWNGTSRLIRSLKRMLTEWKEWNTLGTATPYRDPPRTEVAGRSVNPGRDGVPTLGDVDMLDHLVADDLFFDWNLWMQGDASWSFV